MNKVIVLGLDGMPPEMLFGELGKQQMPNLQRLIARGMRGILESTIPPSTTIAWNALASGKDASHLGIYSYTFRENGKTRLYNSTHVRAPLLWDILSEAGKRVVVLNVPLTYPPRKINGFMVTDFLTPDASCEYTYPPSFKRELEDVLGAPYIFDATEAGLGGYKSAERGELLKRIYEMTDLHLRTLEYVLKTKEWDFLICVLLGTDRILHTFLSYHDKTHVKYVPGSAFEDALPQFFAHLDQRLGNVLSLLDEETTIIVCSDHGIKNVKGKVNLNDWLIRERYLALKAPPSSPTRFDPSLVDEQRTRAYAIGSYQGRVYFNRKEMKPDERAALQQELASKLKAIPDDKGRPLKTTVYRPQDIFQGPFAHQAPDLIVYFDNLEWGVNNDVGNRGLHSWEDQVGATDGGHSPEGIIVVAGAGVRKGGDLGRMSIADVFPLILSRLGFGRPEGIERWNHAFL